jgi:hypothetical protein
VIAIELAVVGALLWQIRYFDRDETTRRAGEHRPDPRVLLPLAVALSATVFGSLWGIRHHGQATSASAVTFGLAVSLLPILVRVLPPLARNAETTARDPDFAYTVAGLLLYVAVVASAIVLLNV